MMSDVKGHIEGVAAAGVLRQAPALSAVAVQAIMHGVILTLGYAIRLPFLTDINLIFIIITGN